MLHTEAALAASQVTPRWNCSGALGLTTRGGMDYTDCELEDGDTSWFMQYQVSKALQSSILHARPCDDPMPALFTSGFQS